MTRRCSHCSNDEHNSRTCPSRGGGGIPGGGSSGGGGVGCRGGGGGGGVKLFGVMLTDGSIMKKSASMGNLSHYQSSSSAAASPNPTSPSADPLRDPIRVRDGYLSDEPVLATCSFNRRSERKKGVPWTEEEHRMFLVGLQKLGKGEWRGIARNFVVSRTPTQVASHAQKYFIRKSNGPRRKRRSSLFDMVPNMTSDPPPVPEEQHLPQSSEIRETNSSNPTPPLDLSLKSEFEPMDTTPEGTVEETEELEVPSDQPPIVAPTFFPAYIPVSFPLWLPSTTLNEEEKGTTEVSHEVLKPTPVLPKEPVDEVAGMSQLSLGGLKHGGHIEPSPLSLQLLATPSRPSAFHVNASVSGSDMSDKSNAIQAI